MASDEAGRWEETEEVDGAGRWIRQGRQDGAGEADGAG